MIHYLHPYIEIKTIIHLIANLPCPFCIPLILLCLRGKPRKDNPKSQRQSKMYVNMHHIDVITAFDGPLKPG